MTLNRDSLFVIIGVLAVAVGVLSWTVYEKSREPKGVQLTIGPAGISVEKK